MTRLEEEKEVRSEKVQKILALGKLVYPAITSRTHAIVEVVEFFDSPKIQKNQLTIAGRIKSIRTHGGSSFAHIDDGTEAIQIYLKKDQVGSDNYQYFINFFDIGDFIETTGKTFKTKKGEPTILVEKFSMLSKAILPLPEKWHGLSDTEIRYRKRYLDLAVNPAIKKIFKTRALIVKAMRDFFEDNGSIEVETPVLQSIPGGANAKPFKTYHNALKSDLYLRIAPELYLKELIVGGFEKVHEFARCFRNEGIDKDHNPEFTQVEFYAAYWDYNRLMKFTENLLLHIVNSVFHTSTIEYEGNLIDFSPPYEKITFRDACMRFGKVDITMPDKVLLDFLVKNNISVTKPVTRAKLMDEIFKEFVRKNLTKPTFIIDHPVELSPLAKKKSTDPNFVERFQLVAANKELCNAFTELNDPIDQKKRFEDQELLRNTGDEEAQRINDDFLEALSHGMPPTAGIGIGIDRLTALLTNSHTLKEVILFPALKQKRDGS